MGKAGQYATDSNISLQDKVFGTDADDDSKNKNYVFEDIIAFLIEQGFSNSGSVSNVVKTVITEAEVKQLFTTPITILDSSESGKVKYPINVYIKRNAGTAYNLATSAFSIINDNDEQMSSNLNPNPLISTSAGYFQSAVNVIQNLSGGIKNEFYKLKANAGNPTTGTGSLEVYVTYFEITL